MNATHVRVSRRLSAAPEVALRGGEGQVRLLDPSGIHRNKENLCGSPIYSGLSKGRPDIGPRSHD